MIWMIVEDHLKKLMILLLCEVAGISLFLLTDYLQINEPIAITCNVVMEDTSAFVFSVDLIHPDLIYSEGTWKIERDDLTFYQRQRLIEQVAGFETEYQQQGRSLAMFYMFVIQLIVVFMVEKDSLYPIDDLPFATLFLSLIHDGLLMIMIALLFLVKKLFGLHQFEQGLFLSSVVLFSQFSFSLTSLFQLNFLLDGILLKVMVFLLAIIKKRSSFLGFLLAGTLCFLYYFFSLGVLNTHYEMLFPFMPIVSIAYQLVFALSVQEKIFCILIHFFLILLEKR